MAHCCEGGGSSAGTLDPRDRRSLREWWHGIQRNIDRYSCYAMLLILPSDKEMYKYLTEFGKELDLISGENCLILAMGGTTFRRTGFNERLWELAVEEHVSEGHSIRIAQLYSIDFLQLPCLVVFRDIRSPHHITITFKGMAVEEIADKMRAVFSTIQAAISSKADPVEALEAQRNSESLRKAGKTIVGQLRSIAGRTFETAMEAWIKANIK